MAASKVAVIGAGTHPLQTVHDARINIPVIGVTGLVTLKNLREEGFNAKCFESSDFIGGVWSFSENKNETSILQCKNC